MQARKKVEKEGKQIVMNISLLHYTFPCPLGIILSELEEENPIDNIEESLSQLFIGATYEDKPSKSLEFPMIPEGAMQN